MKCKTAKATITYMEDFTNSIQELIDDEILFTKEDIETYIKDCICDDIQNIGMRLLSFVKCDIKLK